MPGVFTIGGYVDSRSEPNGAVQLRCPSCGHYTAGVTRRQLVPDAVTSRTDVIDCACFYGRGIASLGVLPPIGCDCVARYRVSLTTTGGRYVVTSIDEAEMTARIRARWVSAQEAVAIQDELLTALAEASQVPATLLGPANSNVAVAERKPRRTSTKPTAKPSARSVRPNTTRKRASARRAS